MSQPAQILNPADVIGRRWVIDVRDPKPRKRYLHVVSGPTWTSFGWAYWSNHDHVGAVITETALQRAMAEGVEIPPGTDPLDYTCSECGQVFHPSYVGNDQIGLALRKRGLCFIDDFWSKAHAEYLAGKRLVVDGQSYTIAPERSTDPASCKGHGGRRFRIQYPDGRVVESTNVWSQGPIPERWRDRMPDTATFLPDEPSPGMQFKHEGFLRTEARR